MKTLMILKSRLAHCSLMAMAIVGTSVRQTLAATLGERAAAVTTEFQQYGGLVNVALILIGLVLFGSGLLGLRKAQQHNEGSGGYILTIVVGVVLMSIGAVIAMTSETVTGSDSTELDKIGI